jgi:hypothetical protein
MARLKVKQISDFTSAVQGLIDSDNDQAASFISSALSAGVSAGAKADGIATDLATEIAATNGDVTRIDGLLASVGTSANVSSALSAGVSAGVKADGVQTNLTAEIGATNADVNRIDAVIASAADAADVTAVSNALTAFNDVAGTDLDQISEVISYVDSLDTADGGALTLALTSIDTAVSVSLSTDVVLSDALAAEILATNGDVTRIDGLLASVATDGELSAEVASIDTVLGSMGTSATITAISDALAVEIGATNNDVTRIDAVIASAADAAVVTAVSNGLAAEILATGNEITAIDNSIDSLETLIGTADDFLHEFGTFRSSTRFQIANAVQFASTDDLNVFINGHNIHPLTSGEAGVGYATTDGEIFNFSGIGYDLEAGDTFYVTGKKA